jgi:hypothetical protein
MVKTMARNIFNTVAMAFVPSNIFDMRHDVKTSFNMGELCPTMCVEVLPGDEWSIEIQNMMRFAPLVSPVMHKVDVYTHVYFVPNRILWSQWEDFISEASGAPASPYMVNLHTLAEGDLGDYLGIPIGLEASEQLSPLPVAAYLKIYDEYYRDNNVISTEAFIEVVAGNNLTYDEEAKKSLYKRAWQHDYFTSALPTAQQGSTVSIPLVESEAPVDFITGVGQPGKFRNASTDALITSGGDIRADSGGDMEHNSATEVYYDPNDTLQADVESVATDINTLRRAFKLQEFLERTIRGGTRYIEQILSHFGTRSSDSRLNRPEYIGGVKQKMVISEVLSTAETIDSGDNVTSPIGNLSGHGISVGGNKFRYRCEEHGFIMAITSVMPQTAYQDGVHKMWTRTDRTDYAWPSFANIGEQEVLQREIYAYTASENDDVFGYVPRYAEYKYMNSQVSGKFRSSLNYWHLGRKFATKPTLSQTFIECTPDDRIFADQTAGAHHIYAHIYNNAFVKRKLPKFGIPQL